MIFVCKLDANNSYKGGNALVCNGWLRQVLFIVNTPTGPYWPINSKGVYNKLLDTVKYLLDCDATYKTLVLKYCVFSLRIKWINVSTLSPRKL